MPESADRILAYLCECGKKWSFSAKEAANNQTFKCRCGRLIVIGNGFVYSKDKGR